MSKTPDITALTRIDTAVEPINDNFEKVSKAFENTLSLDGSTPNAMEADIDLNGYSILNVKDLTTAEGTSLNDVVDEAEGYASDAADSASEAADSAAEAEASATRVDLGALDTAVEAAETAQAGAETAESNVNSTISAAVDDAVDAATSRAETAASGAEESEIAASDAADRSENAADDAETSADLAATYAGIDHNAATWTALAAVSGLTGEVGYVSDADTGMHTDPITASTVSNAGFYTWEADGLGSAQAKWVGDTGLSGKVNKIDLPALGVGQGTTGDETLLAAFTDESLKRTWLEILKSTAGPSEYSAALILGALEMSDLSATQVSQLKAALGVGTSPDVVSVASAPAPIPLATAAQITGREYPTLAKLDSNPIFEASDQSAVSIFWPWIVDMSMDGGSGYALFWSSDHGSHANSGTWLATATTPEGPWTHHGMIFRDDETGGEQHETPSVVWDEDNNRWLMYYQLKNVSGYTNQLTLVAEAPSILDSEGVPSSWSVIGVSATENYTNNAGDGHSGYFKPFRYDGGWYAHGLYGGTNNSRGAFWISNDGGLTYNISPRVFGASQHILSHLEGFDSSNWVLKINSGAQIERNGQLWWIGPAGPAAAGGAEIPTARIVACRVASDGVTLGRAVDITPPLQSWEDSELGVDQLGNAVAYDGHIYMTYRAGGGSGGFGLMEVF